jgi:coenzyme F420-0:L-glutamate ligase/coenzyme F420-1:gamma-L-glutamate ligase
VTVSIVPVEGIPEVHGGDDLAAIVADALAPHDVVDGDVAIVTQKIVSKAEGRVVRDDGDGRRTWIERETRRVVARRGDLVIAETRHGFVCANAGVDASNVAEGWICLLPEDPDASAERLRQGLRERLGADVAVVITDTFGRPWREGLVNVAIGCAGIPAIVDLRGRRDHHGRALEATIVAVADELAAASGLVMGKASRIPVALLRGYRPGDAPPSPAGALVRRPEDDLFREAPLWQVTSAASATALVTRDVPREVLEEAVAAAAARADAVVTYVAATSRPARGRIAAAAAGIDAALADAGALIVPLVPARALASPEVDALVAAGGALERLALALHAQAFGWTWTPLPHRRREPVRVAIGADREWSPLGVIAIGGARTGAASPRPPFDLSASLRMLDG